MHNDTSVRTTEINITYPFNTVAQAIRYIDTHNPARQKSINFFEIDRPGRREYHDLTGCFGALENQDIWASTLAAYMEVINAWSDHPNAVGVFDTYYRPQSERVHVSDMAKELRVHTSTLYRWIADMSEELERKLIKRGLLDDEE